MFRRRSPKASTITTIREDAEGPISLTNEKRLTFMPKGSETLEIPWDRVSQLEYGQKVTRRKTTRETTHDNAMRGRTRAQGWLDHAAGVLRLARGLWQGPHGERANCTGPGTRAGPGTGNDTSANPSASTIAKPSASTHLDTNPGRRPRGGSVGLGQGRRRPC